MERPKKDLCSRFLPHNVVDEPEVEIHHSVNQEQLLQAK